MKLTTKITLVKPVVINDSYISTLTVVEGGDVDIKEGVVSVSKDGTYYIFPLTNVLGIQAVVV